MKLIRRPAGLVFLLALIFALCLSGCGEPKAESVESIALVVTADDISQLEEYTNLKEADLTGSDCYAAIAEYAAAHPEVSVTYTVSLGGTEVLNSETSLVLEEGSYEYDTLMENLAYLPKVTSIELPKTTLSAEELSALRETYPGVDVSCTVELLGREISPDVEELDLSALTPSEVDEAAAQLALLPSVTQVELMSSSGKSQLGMSDVKKLEDAAPDAVFHYVFELYGQTLSTTDETVEYVDVEIGNEGVDKIREALDIMCCCTYFKLEECGIDSETMALLRDDYPDTKIVWRVHFGYFSCLTDEETIRAIFDLNDSNCSELKYCTDVKYMDIGHDSDLYDTSFIAYMTKLEICILSGSPFSDMTPFANCPNLMFLELVWCGNVTDLSPLQNCMNLQYLNISYTKVTDLSPLYDKPMERFVYYGPQVSSEAQTELAEKLPDCWVTFDGLNPYVLGWRYDDQGYTWCDMYKFVREVFRYEENFYNH